MNQKTPKKILIIEDEIILSDLLAKKLKGLGVEVMQAFDGQEGLKKIEEFKPNLLLLDIVMPKLDGFQVMREIKSRGLPSIPIIIISNSGQKVELDKAIELGASDFLIKAEINPEEVVEKINKLL
jgi:CheY-like chemotaxis protein